MSFFTALPIHTQLLLGIISILILYFHIRYDDKTLIYGPTILTTTGIFATFFGIALGLTDFDTTNIQASIPALLDGLKTAFWASVFGVGGALTIKFRHFFIGIKQEIIEPGTEVEVTSADLVKLLQGIQQAIIGNDDSTLVSQLKLMRQDTNDRLDALKNAQREALLMLSEMGSKTLAEALRDVIKDFNSRLTEQFGDNFKQLNEAVGKLLIWQSQYKAHIEAATERHKKIVDSMEIASDNYQKLVSEAERFTAISTDLANLLTALETQKQQLTNMLGSLAGLLKSASGSLPKVEKKILELTEQLTRSVTANQQVVGEALTKNSQLIKTSIENVGQDFSRINQEFNNHLGDMAEKTNKQISALDAALTEELKKSLESLGRQLAALSEKFVDDYGPLTDRLRDIVHLAKQSS